MPLPKDYTGYKNEYLEIIEKYNEEMQIELNKNRNTKAKFYKAKCRCGNIFDISQVNISRTKSCGCSRYRMRFLDNHEAEYGNKYGKYTIVEIDMDKTLKEYSDGKRNGVFYKCKCKCGNERTVVFRALKSGHISSCGCIKFNNPNSIKDLSGNTYNRLTVISRDLERDKNKLIEINNGSPSTNRVHWLCKCNCGKITSVSGYQLKSGKTKSCGCLNSEITAERNRRDSTKINRVFRSKRNEYDTKNEYVRIYSEDEENSCIVDIDDYEFIKKWFWRKENKKGYWITNAKKEDLELYGQTTLKIHQLIAMKKYGNDYDDTLIPDHLNRDPDDNRKCNLIQKTNIENTHNRSLSKTNTSGKTGVYFRKDTEKWTASITVNYKTIYLGDFKDKQDAINARLEAEEKYGFTCDDIYPEYDDSLTK